ncbi:MAG TPA: hypothetical protein VF137_12700 [Candidatus Dormibacteraeota bacterium]
MAAELRFQYARLTVGSPVAGFYRGLGFDVDGTAVQVGETVLEFSETGGGAFHHFAFLAPGNRFDAAYRWARERVDVLRQPGTGRDVFDFDFWDARAFYFHDPAGDIAEVIAHRGLEDSDASGDFSPLEIVGLSELMLVGDPAALARQIPLPLWAGDVGGLAFIGRKARTLILAARGRPLLPLGRPAETHPAEVVLERPGEQPLRFTHG